MAIDTTKKRTRHPGVHNNPLTCLFLNGVQMPAAVNGPIHLWDVPVNSRVLDAFVAVEVAAVHGAAACNVRLVLCSKTNAAPATSLDIVAAFNAEAVGISRIAANGVGLTAPDSDTVLALVFDNAPDTTPATVSVMVMLDRDDLEDL